MTVAADVSALATYSFPTTIVSGPGARQGVAARLQAHGVSRPLVVTDRGVAALDWWSAWMEQLNKAGLEPQVFSGFQGNPLESHVRAAVECYRNFGCDGLLGVGGGAALDVAKASALMIHHPGGLFDYQDGDPQARPIDQPIPYLVAVPTTAGTGSEVGRSAVIGDDETHAKRVIFSPRLLPSCVFSDPELTLALPPSVTAATGMDALTHLIEAYLARGSHPMCDGIALEGIWLVAQSLEECVSFARDPARGPMSRHLEVRHAMLNAAMMGAVAFQKGLGVTHSCAHALSTVADLHHGLANGIMLPVAMAFNLPAKPAEFARMAIVAGLERASGEAFLEWLKSLRRAIGIPDRLREQGIEADQIEALVGYAQRDGCHHLNPRPVAPDDFRALFTQAF